MQLSGQGGGWRVVFPTSAIMDVRVGSGFGDGLSFLVVLSLAFIVVLALAFSDVAFTFAFPAVALSIPSWSLVGGGIAAGVESLSAAAGRIRG